jgi:Fe-only nitrogenase accessory protein AnfO
LKIAVVENDYQKTSSIVDPGFISIYEEEGGKWKALTRFENKVYTAKGIAAVRTSVADIIKQLGDVKILLASEIPGIAFGTFQAAGFEMFIMENNTMDVLDSVKKEVLEMIKERKEKPKEFDIMQFLEPGINKGDFCLNLEEILLKNPDSLISILKKGDNDAGYANIMKAMQMDDSRTDTYKDLAAQLSKLKRHDDAIAIYEKLITKGFDKANTYFTIGKEYYYKGITHKEIYDSTKVIPGAASLNDSIIARQSFFKADSFFTLVSTITPDFYGSYLWKGRVLSLVDTEMKEGLAKEPYEKALAILEKENASQNIGTIIECYKYLGAYYYFQSEMIGKTDKTQSASYKNMAIEYYKKIVAARPDDTQSKEILDQLTKPS